MDFYTTPTTTSSAAVRCGAGRSRVHGDGDFSIAMDRFVSTADRKCSLQIDPRRT
ncbi:hypothetical protein ACN9MJ_20860 [Acidovorax facilis]|uniref:Uncharacterized protein n=1 Tax=Acidovorax facilis TaxID=12917 RepID=A0ABV8DHX0_9BURK|nr:MULTISPECIES: hypothetical protein [Acidovorax]MCO4244603.1 hypothetical protein [Acidovorax facilis]